MLLDFTVINFGAVGRIPTRQIEKVKKNTAEI